MWKMIQRQEKKMGLRAQTNLWRLVADALENELTLDVNYRKNFIGSRINKSIPNFKVMKQLALQAQLGWIYPVLIALAPIAVLVAVPGQWLLLLIGTLVSQRDVPTGRACKILATTIGNRAIIDAALDADPSTASVHRYQINFGLVAMGAEIQFSQCWPVFLEHLRWLRYALTSPVEKRRDLLLHGNDALALFALATIARQPSLTMVTDDHYQRWAHVLSHSAEDFRIVQHGFLNEELVLPHSGGLVTCLYIRDVQFCKSFERFYRINDHQLFSPLPGFVQTPLSNSALLLASSFPTIDEELQLLEATREYCRDISIIVKFHPAHHYDSRKLKLAKCANIVFEGLGNPSCKIFVSYGSFMEFDYRQQGIATVSIARSGSVEAAADEIRAHYIALSQSPGAHPTAYHPLTAIT